jgi:hypothetical protein
MQFLASNLVSRSLIWIFVFLFQYRVFPKIVPVMLLGTRYTNVISCFEPGPRILTGTLFLDRTHVPNLNIIMRRRLGQMMAVTLRQPFYVVRYSCDVTDAILIPLPYNEWRHIEIAFMRQADTTFPKRYCAMPTLNVKLSLIG